MDEAGVLAYGFLPSMSQRSARPREYCSCRHLGEAARRGRAGPPAGGRSSCRRSCLEQLQQCWRGRTCTSALKAGPITAPRAAPVKAGQDVFFIATESQANADIPLSHHHDSTRMLGYMHNESPPAFARKTERLDDRWNRTKAFCFLSTAMAPLPRRDRPDVVRHQCTNFAGGGASVSMTGAGASAASWTWYRTRNSSSARHRYFRKQIAIPAGAAVRSHFRRHCGQQFHAVHQRQGSRPRRQ
jgi:hypothetical protein